MVQRGLELSALTELAPRLPMTETFTEDTYTIGCSPGPATTA